MCCSLWELNLCSVSHNTGMQLQEKRHVATRLPTTSWHRSSVSLSLLLKHNSSLDPLLLIATTMQLCPDALCWEQDLQSSLTGDVAELFAHGKTSKVCRQKQISIFPVR